MNNDFWIIFFAAEGYNFCLFPR